MYCTCLTRIHVPSIAHRGLIRSTIATVYTTDTKDTADTADAVDTADTVDMVDTNDIPSDQSRKHWSLQ